MTFSLQDSISISIQDQPYNESIKTQSEQPGGGDKKDKINFLLRPLVKSTMNPRGPKKQNKTKQNLTKNKQNPTTTGFLHTLLHKQTG